VPVPSFSDSDGMSSPFKIATASAAFVAIAEKFFYSSDNCSLVKPDQLPL
jgi:hypothetical protein